MRLQIVNRFGLNKAINARRFTMTPTHSSSVHPAIRVLSWNVLRKVGAGPDDVAALIDRYRPTLVLLQEADRTMDRLPEIVGGFYARDAFPNRIHGPAIWSLQLNARPRLVQLSGGRTRRHGQIVALGEFTFVNVHLAHGQLACRRQLREAASTIAGAGGVIGDFNMIGPAALPGFSDVGPRESTHVARDIVPVRIDRCFVRGLSCLSARALSPGRSDHRPILLDLAAERTARAA